MGSSHSNNRKSSTANEANNGDPESGVSSHISTALETEIDTRRTRIPHLCGLSIHRSSPKPTTRLYQVWPARNVFFAGGRLVCGPDPRGFLLTSISILLSIWAFCNNVGYGLFHHSRLVIDFSLGLTVIVFINLILAGTRDPGIIPRNDEPPLEAGTSIGAKSKRVVIDGIEIKLKYCKICKIYRPPRSSHCNVCDNCVEKFDHHCMWIGQCIGLRNYRYYMMFIFSAFVFFAYICVFSWWRIGRNISHSSRGVLRFIGDEPETIAVALFSFFGIWFLGGLFAFHVYLILKNQTSRENLKRQYARSPNPHDKGMLFNINDALFRKLPPSKVNFRLEIALALCDSTDSTVFNTAGLEEEESIAGQHGGSHTEELSEKISDEEVCEIKQVIE